MVGERALQENRVLTDIVGANSGLTDAHDVLQQQTQLSLWENRIPRSAKLIIQSSGSLKQLSKAWSFLRFT